LKEQKKLDSILKEAYSAKVKKFINIGTSLKENPRVLETARKYAEIYPTAAVYPHEDKDKSLEEVKEKLEEFVNTHGRELVGIGETGVDITNWKNGRSIEEQMELFKFQAKLAKRHNLPLIIHNRNGDKQILEVLNELKPLSGVIHCFSSEWAFAKAVLDLNFYISFSGFITYNSREYLLETVEKVPNERFLIETDSPYLPPTGHRGEKNEPKYVKIVAQKIADVKGLSLKEVAAFSTTNAQKLFDI
jgi:TatD DNase family protein